MEETDSSAYPAVARNDIRTLSLSGEQRKYLSVMEETDSSAYPAVARNDIRTLSLSGEQRKYLSVMEEKDSSAFPPVAFGQALRSLGMTFVSCHTERRAAESKYLSVREETDSSAYPAVARNDIRILSYRTQCSGVKYLYVMEVKDFSIWYKAHS